MKNNVKKLYRSREHCVIAGVCGGLQAYFGISVVAIRLMFVFLLICGGFGLLLYLVLWLLTPRAEPGQEPEVEIVGPQLVRSKRQCMIAGVCGGLAEYLMVDVVWVRACFLLMLLAFGSTLMIYVVLWIMLPQI